jgi:hypothetical protein
MNYELAKELKEAGFTQPSRDKADGYFYTEKSRIVNAGIVVVDPIECYAPRYPI